MPGLNIFTSNRLEILAEQLSRIIGKPADDTLSSPLSGEIIVVQSKGIERWLSMELARHNGISANIFFPFPNTCLNEIFKKLTPDMPDESLFDPDVMTFRIMDILPECRHRSGFESIKKYLTDDENKQKLFQLSGKISETFDQYLVFRPEIIFNWEDGKEDHWQAKLWRELVSGNENQHRAWLRKALIQKVRDRSDKIADFSLSDLPGRIFIFGISYLPPFHTQVFVELSSIVQVVFFVLNPCMVYWADIVSEKEKNRIKKRYVAGTSALDELHLETGNRLLASMGKQGRDFFELISGFDCELYELFEDQAEYDMLSCVQSDILYLRDREHAKNKFSINIETDTSIQVHSCHSPMREIEVLHDNLLAMFEEIPDLKPKDIIVMTPDIDTYAPFIHAVFDAQAKNSLRIPFSIADRSIRKERRIIESFLSILDLKNSRLGAARIISLLELSGIKEKFEMTESDIQIIRRWINDTKIRWGIDTTSRTRLNLPAFPENTWRTGIDRMLLGYAMPGHERDMFCGILPYDNIEGNEVKILGRFLEFLDRVFKCINDLSQPETLSKWVEIFNSMIDGFFPRNNDDIEYEIQLIRYVLDDISKKQYLSGFDKNISIEVIKTYIETRFERDNSGSGFIAGGVTFCAMLPMRSIPFKVVCLVGMNNDAFPRDSKTLSFDIIAKGPKPGDRLRRNDDKYLFLEALISARKKFYISYVGQSIEDNTRIPPSVVVSELLDCIEGSFYVPEKYILDHVIIRHRLQAFSPEYFKRDSQLFSYTEENFIDSKRAFKSKIALHFVSTGLSEPSKEWKNPDIETLCFFFTNPAKFLIERRLEIFLEETLPVSEDREAFTLEGIEKYHVEQQLFQNCMSGFDLRHSLPVYRAMGRLPYGNVGEHYYRESEVNVKDFVNRIDNFKENNKNLSPVQVDLNVSDFKITGVMDNIFEFGLVNIRYAKRKSKDLLKSWIYHLVFCSSTEQNYLKKSHLVCKDETWEMDSVKESKDILENLLALYWQGLSKPIHFFPETSFDYAKRTLIKKENQQNALNYSKKKWIGEYYKSGWSESDNPYYKLCFSKTDPFDKEFIRIAKEVFAPLLKHCRKI
ncbi:MAG: exodeoxyribonuclease V subunit gamma [Desulfobacteraceae bacterium]|nr:exodeoxyribonuclease V subunit gamma [Desulfobacteraceae bacterium]MBC2719010.1 exodeoxyribonuclease V subunit gamma [Desulfobacteraceae bacterium]